MFGVTLQPARRCSPSLLLLPSIACFCLCRCLSVSFSAPALTAVALHSVITHCPSLWLFSCSFWPSRFSPSPSRCFCVCPSVAVDDEAGGVPSPRAAGSSAPRAQATADHRAGRRGSRRRAGGRRASAQSGECDANSTSVSLAVNPTRLWRMHTCTRTYMEEGTYKRAFSVLRSLIP